MYLSVLVLPLWSCIVSGVTGRFLGKKGSSSIAIGCIALSFCLSLFMFHEVGLNNATVFLSLAAWLESDFLKVNWSLCFDSLTVVMILVVTLISTVVHLYSMEYMKEDPHLPRFMSYLSLFTFFMLILVTADNFIQMFVGWEGVGLSSFLLINFWFTRIQANKAALKAMIVNRIGDFGLALGIFGIYFCLGVTDYSTVFALIPQLSSFTFVFFNVKIKVLNLISFFLFVGAMGKSAQLGLHTWLPDAMEGPTPVSALIHAATMVTAGVFLLARCSPLLEYCPNTLKFITIVGSMTAFFGATTALVQNDLKKVIAYSTCSQLGYMIFACGLSNYSVAIFHLVNHAFFKALLFLGAGSIIHGIGDEQDLRKMGGLRRILPFTYAMMVIGSIALTGMPFLTGFYSKDVILEVSFATYSKVSHFSYYLGSMAAFCTSFYSVRLLFLCFLSEPNGSRRILLSASEGSWPMKFSLGLLAFPSIFAGYLSRDLFIGLGSSFWGNSLFFLPLNLNIVDAEFLPTRIKILPLLCSIIGGSLSFVLYQKYSDVLFSIKISQLGRKCYTYLNRKWLFDKIYNSIFSQGLLYCGFVVTYKTLDRGVIESVGPKGVSGFLFKKVTESYLWQSGYLYHYLIIMIWSNIGFCLFYMLGLPTLDVCSLFLFCILWLTL